MSEIDVNTICKPIADARDQHLTLAADARAQAAAIEQEGQIEAAKVLKDAAEKAAPHHRTADRHEAHAARFNVIIGREEQEARNAQHGNGQPAADGEQADA